MTSTLSSQMLLLSPEEQHFVDVLCSSTFSITISDATSEKISKMEGNDERMLIKNKNW